VASHRNPLSGFGDETCGRTDIHGTNIVYLFYGEILWRERIKSDKDGVPSNGIMFIPSFMIIGRLRNVYLHDGTQTWGSVIWFKRKRWDLMNRIHNSEFLVFRLLSKLIQFHNIRQVSRREGFRKRWSWHITTYHPEFACTNWAKPWRISKRTTGDSDEFGNRCRDRTSDVLPLYLMLDFSGYALLIIHKK
jgi:hypothetical protein